MDFLSRAKSPSFVFRHGHPKMVDGSGNLTQAARPSAIIKFEPAANPYPTRKLAGKDNQALGRLFLHKVVADFKRCGWEGIGPQDIRDFLVHHPDHGREFVYVSGDAEALQTEWLVPEEGNKGMLYCRLCDQYGIDARGSHGHKHKKKHKELLEVERQKDAELLMGRAELPPVETHAADVSA